MTYVARAPVAWYASRDVHTLNHKSPLFDSMVFHHHWFQWTPKGENVHSSRSPGNTNEKHSVYDGPEQGTFKGIARCVAVSEISEDAVEGRNGRRALFGSSPVVVLLFPVSKSITECSLLAWDARRFHITT